MAVARAMTGLHSTEPFGVHLAVQARSACAEQDVDRALYEDRVLVRQLAMRRTLFAFPRELLPAVWGSASARVAAQIRPRYARDVEAAGIADDGERWLRRQVAAVLEALADGPATTGELRARLPELERRLDLARGTSYAASPAVASRLLTLAAVTGEVVRGVNEGGWRSSRPRWTLTRHWLGADPEPLPPEQGWRELVARWLRTFGPGTETDLVWWLGATKAVVRRALDELGAVEVGTGSGPAYLLPDDLDPVPEPEPSAALLPPLDPTVMGWKRREFYLGEHGPRLFDRNGNAGGTAWWCGRVVGGWAQDSEGVVRPLLLEDLGTEARSALRTEAERLTDWLGGQVVGSIYHSPLTREAMRA